MIFNLLFEGQKIQI